MFDGNGQYTGQLFGQDRRGHTTPDLESSDTLRPFLPVPYPAPWLPMLRQDQGHPELANVVFSTQMGVGQDKSGALVPAGLFCGAQPNGAVLPITQMSISSNVLTLTVANKLTTGEKFVVSGATGSDAYINGTYTATSGNGSAAATVTAALTHADVSAKTPAGVPVAQSQAGGQYCILVYSQTDVGFARNAQTGSYVAAAGEHVVLGCPADAVAGNVTMPNGTVVAVSSGDITFALACDIFPTGVARPIGVAVRNVLQYIGGVSVTSSTNGMLYKLDGVTPIGYVIHNYMHEMGTAVQTQFILRLPWIGATTTTLTSLTSGDGVVGYKQGYGRTFTHFTGTPKVGQMVVASCALGDAGNYTTYDPTKNQLADVMGKIIGVMDMTTKIGFLARVRSLWDPTRLTGPIADPNPASIRMGGSATGGIDYVLNLTTDAAYVLAKQQGKTLHSEYATYVLVRVNL